MGHFWRDCEAYKYAKLQCVVPNFSPPKFQSQSPPVPTRTVAGTGRTSQSGCGQSFSINTGFESELPNEKTIGTRPTEIVKIAGREFLGLIDTGSQVTMLSEAYYHRYLAPNGIKLMDIDWLQVSAANGQKIPYSALFIVDLKVGGVLLRDKGILIAKDTSGTAKGKLRVPGLLGMNILRDVPKYSTLAPKDQTYDQKAGYVRVAGNETVVLPPFSVSEIQILSSHSGRLALVEPLSEMICCGARVAPGLIQGTRSKAVVQVTNFSDKCLEIAPRTKVAIACAAEEVVSEPSNDVGSASSAPHNKGSIHQIQEIGLSGLQGQPQEVQSKVQDVLLKYPNVFDTTELGHTDILQHKIMTTDPFPVSQPYRRIPPCLWWEVKEHIQTLLNKGIIRESKSSYAAPIVVVRKKNGKLRMCFDYRKLNSKIQRDVYPLPRIQESLEANGGAKYHQVEVAEEDRAKTAFVTPFGLYEWMRLPFGLVNAPATFQRLMCALFREDVLEHLIVYLDDVIIFSPDIPTHIERLDKVMRKLSTSGLRVEPNKCQLFKKEVRFLGHLVTANGVRTDPEKIAAVAGWHRPDTLKELRRFLGFCAYYRRFCPGYAKIAAPLHALVADLANQKRGKTVLIGDAWQDIHESSFSQLKVVLTSAPVLGFADFEKPFILETDASEKGLGAVLSQRQGGVVQVIAFASRGLRKAGKNSTIAPKSWS